ncbi:hypothetical protein MKEN_01448300 [Mycena kentingensis (nom. inval.)]|nr:hypothetical protein MKEN_01448300 [Mycena kentingensis (nom. inval.)]
MPATPSPSRRSVISPTARGALVRQGAQASLNLWPPIHTGRHNPVTDPHVLLPFRRRVQITKGQVVQYNVDTDRLEPWDWPIDITTGERVPPDQLALWRNTHEMRNPTCLCPRINKDRYADSEMIIFLATTGNLSGQWVCACSRGLCKLWIFLERMYAARGQTVYNYPPRTSAVVQLPLSRYNYSQGLPYSPSEASTSANSTPNASPAQMRRLQRSSSTLNGDQERENKRQRTNDGLSADAVSASILPTVSLPPLPQPTSTFSSLLQLDAGNNAGLTVGQFKRLFVKCRACPIVTTKSAFEDHICRPQAEFEDVIDLTLSDSDA